MTDPVDPVDRPAEPYDDQPAPEDAPDDPGPRRYPSTIGGAFYLAVLATAGAAVGIVVGGDWRVGVRVLAGGLAAAAGLRLLLRQRDAGMLAVRHRLVDVALLAGVAGALWWLAGSIPEQST